MAEPMAPQRALWRAVIDRAIEDATSTSSATAVERDKALAWLLRPSIDFDNVCALAGLEPDHVRRYAMQRIEGSAIATPKPSKARRVARQISFNGESRTLNEWAEHLGISRDTLASRLNHLGWSVDRALTTPAQASRASSRGRVKNFQVFVGDRRGEARARSDGNGVSQ